MQLVRLYQLALTRGTGGWHRAWHECWNSGETVLICTVIRSWKNYSHSDY
jgi:hypothetical protein